ncbi:polyribonucleotide nucleotidyltransferase [Desulfobotulus mexicanus]|uniref:polyribonucleotide nucleotidyltransferase n=1 Tax=Desulfobotulus mexicanus TaxID=2586642 RepID=UPI0015D2AAB1|nr:polyribonucleotide nucleotidyltransferase [Desulfobotulus mexicanus]
MKSFQRVLVWMVLFLCLVPLTGCGTLLYPERRHQQLQLDPGGRRIDPAVAVMDAACLIFFIIPGIVAFAVDFATGAIYLPGGSASLDSEKEPAMASLPADKREIEDKVRELAGISFDMDDPRMEAFVLDKGNSF